MFPKQSSKNRHARSPEMLGAHNPEGQIINKTCHKTKQKFYFSRLLWIPDPPINTKTNGYTHLQRPAVSEPLSRTGEFRTHPDFAGKRARVCWGFAQTIDGGPTLAARAWQANAVLESVHSRLTRISSP